MHEEIAGAQTTQDIGEMDSRSSASCDKQADRADSEIGVAEKSATGSHRSIEPVVSTRIELTEEQIDFIATSSDSCVDNVQGIYPLSPLQEGMLFHRLLNEQGDTYVLSTLFELQSREHVTALVSALQIVIDRHDSLRSSLHSEQVPRPLQVVHCRAILPVEEVTLDPNHDAIAQMKERMRPGGPGLDLGRAPLLRLEIAADARSSRWYAVLRVHHAICDHQSLRLVVAEALVCLAGRACELPTPVSFEDHFSHSVEHVQPRDGEKFFHGKLADIDEPTAPFGLMNVHGDGATIQQSSCTLERSLCQLISAQARRCGVSAARLFHVAWGLVVARTTGRSDVVFGTVVSTERQRSARSQRMVGLFVNTLPLRLGLQNVTIRELVEQTHRELTELVEYGQVPLAVAQRCGGISVTGAPLFTTLFNYRRSRPDFGADVDVAGVRALDRGEAWTNYPITLIVDDLGEGFTLTAQTDRRIDPSRITGYLRTALESLVTALEHAQQTPALTLQVLPQQERQQVIELFNATQADYPHDKLIHQLFEEQVERTPHAVAVTHADQYLTYRQLNGKANQLARHLRKHGAGADRFVGLCVERGIEMVVGILGILKAGSAYVPLDPDYPQHRLEHMLQDTAPVAVLTLHPLADRLPNGRTLIALDMQWDEVAQHSALNLDSEELGVNSTNLAYVIYTSGSTGLPKGVAIEHRNAVNLIWWAQSAMASEVFEQTLLSTSLNFDLSVYELFVPLISGGSLRVVQNALALINEPAGVTLINTVPSAIKSIIDTSSIPPTTRVVNLAGEALKQDLVERIFATSRVSHVCNLYGPSETTTYSTWVSMPRESAFIGTIGHPIANTKIYILDSHGQAVPVGVVGEIYIGGAGVARGYLNRPELTQERFVLDPFSDDPRARLYRTGDLGRWSADGAIEYLGRNDHQVKIRGFRIELSEIEAHLLRHEQVKEIVVIAREDVPGEKRLVAYVVAQDPVAAPSVESLRGYLKALVPDHMVPSAFVTLHSLPLTPNGKLDRRALPAPELDAYVSRPYEPPRGEVEEILAGIWQSLLGVERVGRQDNFFELGGHSLLIVQMMERLRRVGLSVEVRRVFENSTVAELGSVLTNETVEQFEVPPNLIPLNCKRITPEMLPLLELAPHHIEQIVQSVPGGAENIQDIYPLTPLQEGILFHHLLDQSRGDTYVLTMLLSVSSQARLEALIAAVQTVIDRHDVLRTAIAWEQLPRAIQVVCRQASLSVEKIALATDREPMEQLSEWLQPEHQQIDLRRAPLLHIKVAEDAGTGQCHVLLQLHHIIIDHVTVENVTAEIVAHLEGHTQISTEPAPYRNHVAQSLAHARAHDAEAFFRSKLADIDEPTAPFGLLDVHGDSMQIEEAREEIESTLAQRVRMQARRSGVSSATLFHAAWALVLAHTSGRNDVVFGSLLLGRLQGRVSVQQTLGVFINTLPLRLQLRDLSATKLVEHTQRELIALLNHEQASLAVAQRCSGITGSAPLFTALLNYRHSVSTIETQWSGANGIRMLAVQERTNYPITLSVDDLGEDFTLTAQTDRRIDPSRITGYLRTALESLVTALEQAPQTLALTLPILPPKERRQVIELFNATHADYPHHKLIHQLFEEQVERTPHAVAVTHSDQHLTYRQLNNKANQLARHLREQGISTEQLVGICVERGLEMVIGLLGILKAGAAYLPLDPTYPTERLQHMLTDAAPRIVLTQETLRAALPSTAEVIALDTKLPMLTGSAENLPPAASTNVDLVYVIYTSGSTGLPKGTAMPHRSMVNLIEWHRKSPRLATPARVLQFAALSFDVAFQEIFSTLCTGGELVLLDEWVRRDARALTRLIRDRRIERLFVPPMMLQSIAEVFNAGPSDSFDSLRDVITAGEQLRLSAEIKSLFKRLSACRLHNHYGPTETHVVTALILADDPAEWPTLPTIGVPISNSRIYVLDERRQPVPLGAIGEMYIGGANVARGYLTRPELTAERFVLDPFGADAHARMYKTGDLARWLVDGTIEYLGRNDDQVKIRGYRIELGEIEARLMLHKQIREAAAIVREDIAGEKRLVAYLTLYDQADVSTEELRAHIKGALPDHMIPSAFLVLGSMPLTPSGKLNRRALPAPDSYVSGKQYKPPQGELESTMAEIWRELLRVPRVGRDDDFFELGGHSLLAMQALARIQSSLLIEIPIRMLFEHPSVKQLCARIEDMRRALLIDKITEGDVDMQEMLGRLTSMPESEIQELLRRATTERRL